MKKEEKEQGKNNENQNSCKWIETKWELQTVDNAGLFYFYYEWY